MQYPEHVTGFDIEIIQVRKEFSGNLMKSGVALAYQFQYSPTKTLYIEVHHHTTKYIFELYGSLGNIRNIIYSAMFSIT